jgi:hypothetical protein
MGKADVMAREYLSDRSRFADAFNYLLYGGRRIIDPERLAPLDTAETVANPKRRSRKRPLSMNRDALKLWRAMRGRTPRTPYLGWRSRRT